MPSNSENISSSAKIGLAPFCTRKYPSSESLSAKTANLCSPRDPKYAKSFPLKITEKEPKLSREKVEENLKRSKDTGHLLEQAYWEAVKEGSVEHHIEFKGEATKPPIGSDEIFDPKKELEEIVKGALAVSPQVLIEKYLHLYIIENKHSRARLIKNHPFCPFNRLIIPGIGSRKNSLRIDKRQ